MYARTLMQGRQVCNLTWSLTSHELVSTHGYSSTPFGTDIRVIIRLHHFALGAGTRDRVKCRANATSKVSIFVSACGRYS